MTQIFPCNQGDVTAEDINIERDKGGIIPDLEIIGDDEFAPTGVSVEVYKVRKFEEDRKKVMAALDAKGVS